MKKIMSVIVAAALCGACATETGTPQAPRVTLTSVVGMQDTVKDFCNSQPKVAIGFRIKDTCVVVNCRDKAIILQWECSMALPGSEAPMKALNR